MSSQIEAVKDAIDVVALIGERVKLTRAGKNFKGLCPFHSEKSPSFFVTPELGRYKCFGCQESGDALTFLQKYDNMTFTEALEFLAKRAGIRLEHVPKTQDDQKRERLLQALSLTREYYHYLLLNHQIAEDARLYIQNRGLHTQTIELFGIGYAPPSWDGLQRYLIGKKHFTQQELLDSGLIIRSDTGRVYDRFRGRLMFPLTNHRGQTVGFSGRVLEKDAKEAKYINSPETSLYHKSELLFGFSQLSRFIRQQEEVIVTEGEFDALSSYQAHVSNVVAIKGSALTLAHVKLLAKSVKRIILSLDADAAGIKATKRAIEVVKESGLDVSLRVVPLVGGKDPDEIARHTPSVWRDMVAASTSVYEFLISTAFAAHDSATGDGKKEITTELVPVLAGIQNAVEQTHYIQKVAKRLHVSEDVLMQELRKVRFPALATKSMELAKKPVHKSRAEVLQRYLLSLLLSSSVTDFPRRYNLMQQKIECTGVYKKLIDEMKSDIYTYSPATVAARIPEELKETFAVLYLEATEVRTVSDEDFENVLTELSTLQQKEKRQAAAVRLGELEQQPTLTEEQRLEFSRLLAIMKG